MTTMRWNVDSEYGKGLEVVWTDGTLKVPVRLQEEWDRGLDRLRRDRPYIQLAWGTHYAIGLDTELSAYATITTVLEQLFPAGVTGPKPPKTRDAMMVPEGVRI